jgi:two-component system OmpR family response regulator
MLDIGAMLLWVDGRHVHVTVQEFILLRVLMENAGRVMGREVLLNLAWGPEQGRLSNTLQVFMSRLRRKLARTDGTSRIRTVRSVGYVFDVAALG